jgi:F-type H+-transporting ATPase subunit b
MSTLATLAPWLPVLASSAGGGESAPGLADPSLPHWGWTWVVFGLVFLVLWKFAWKPLREQLEAREQRIHDTVEKARTLNADAMALLEKHKEQMDRAKADAQEIIDQGKEAGDKVKAEALEAGQQEAQVLLDRAKKEIDLQTKKALDEIRRETVDLTILAASQVLERSLEDEDHRRLTAGVIDEIGNPRGEG